MENGTTQWRLFCPRVHQASGGPNTAVAAVESRELMAMTIWLLAQNSHSRDRFVARHNGWAVADHSWFSQWAKSYLLATLFNAIERPWSCPVFCSSQFINTFKRTERSSLDTWANDVDNRAKPFWTQPWKNGHIIKPQKAPRELSTVFENQSKMSYLNISKVLILALKFKYYIIKASTWFLMF